MRYRKKPVEVEAWQVGSEPEPEWAEARRYPAGIWRISADGSYMECSDGDFIVRERWMTRVVSRQEFEQTYEVIE